MEARPPTSRPAGGVIRGGHLDSGEEASLARRGGGGARDPLRYVFESSVHVKRMEARPPTSRPAGGVIRGGHLDDGKERLARAARPAAGARDPLRYVFESSVHVKRMEARPPTSRPAGGVIRGGHLDDGEERLALARRGRRPARRDPLRYVFESSVHVKRMEARPPTSRPAGGVIRGGHLDDGEERLALARRGRRPARRDPLRYVFESSAPAISTMHVIIRATVLSCAFTFATAAGGVKLNKKAYPVEAVVAIFKDFHPTASEADLAGIALANKGLEASDTSPAAGARPTRAPGGGGVKLNKKAYPVEAVVAIFKDFHPTASEADLARIALALKGLEASDTSPEAVPSDDAEDADVDGLPGVEDSARHLSEACADSTTWHKIGDDEKNCAWVGKKKAKRCTGKVKSEGGVLASVACPVACDTCLAICEEAKQDLEETLAEEKQTCAEEKQTCADEKQTCAQEKQTCAEEKQTCAEEKAALEGLQVKVLASDACPVACDACPTWAEVTEDLTEVTEALTEALTEVTETCDAAEAKNAALEAELEEAVADKAEAEVEKAALKAELEEAVADKTEAQGNVTTLEAENAALEAENAELKAAKASGRLPDARAVPVALGVADARAVDDADGLARADRRADVGRRRERRRGSDAGHARVFAWDPVDETWKQRGDDIDGEAADDYSGYSVSLSADGTALAVGASEAAPAPARATRVFAWDSDDEAWVQRGGDIDGEAADDWSGYSRGDDIDGEAAYDWSGYSVSLSADGTALAVGRRKRGAGSYAGHARVFAWDPVDETWVQRGDDIDGEAAYDESGISVSLSADGTTLAVGAHYNDGAGSDAGHARVFAWDSVDETWVQRGDDVDGEAADDFSGYSVSLSADGTTLAVGAPYNDGGGTDGPRARVFKASGNDGAGSRAGHARVFAWDSDDETWVQRGDDIDGEAADDWSGYRCR
ncbi:hypothetical protein JL720_16148 [Aureococcus anophagefferens]|nr:hypothetical protein JL720_16148 [Aureococcus anophagefferens]